MEINKITSALGIGLGILTAQQASAFELDFGVIGNSQMQFSAATAMSSATLKLNASTHGTVATGKTFDFQVNATVGGNGGGPSSSSVGDFGRLTGTFDIAPVTTGAAGNTHWYIAANGGTGPGNITDGSVPHTSRIAYQDFTETGVVTGMGSFSLKDQAVVSQTLTGTATLSDLSQQYRVTHKNTAANTIATTVFLSDGLTGNGTVTSSGYTLNITGITYSGTQADLVSLADGNIDPLTHEGRAQLDFTWSFNNKKLTTMTQVGGSGGKVSYSGHVRSDAHSLPDNAMTLALLGTALSGVGFLRKRFAE